MKRIRDRQGRWYPESWMQSIAIMDLLFTTFVDRRQRTRKQSDAGAQDCAYQQGQGNLGKAVPVAQGTDVQLRS